MNILIRTDSSITIGTGHLMRCLTLADALKEKGAEVHFICRDLQGNLSHLVKKHSHKLHLLPAPKDDVKLQANNSPHASWLEVSWQEDLQDTQQITCSVTEKFDWLIVDSYALDYRWEQKMRAKANKIMVIDDLADRKHDCDLLLDQNYFAHPEIRYQDLVPEHCQMLLGPRYALLRPEFRQARKFCRMRGNGTVRILVYFGGNDHDNLTGVALEALSCPELDHIYVDVVVGPHNSYMKNLKEQVKNRSKVRLHVQPESFVELLLRTDLCIGAGGTTTWERLCLNISSIVITTALNQEAFTSELDKANFLHWIGSKNTISTQKIKSVVIQEISKNDSVDTMSMSNMVDGHGALRIAEILVQSLSKTLRIRHTLITDMEIYFAWVNDPVSRKCAFNNKGITWDTHKVWFGKKIDSTKTIMWVLETRQGLPVGQIRFDIQKSVANIDYSLDLFVRGRGWAKILLTMGVNAFKAENRQVSVRAEVKNENHQSCMALQHIGFIEKKQGGMTIFRL
jgi:UDP-2,4-diacetamido-2,4,6-trideoxy-beta-L-altropyranose hydrolase